MTEVKFRNEQFRGSGIRDVYEVMKFELCELRNAGILTTLNRTIFLNMDSVKSYIDILLENIDKVDGIESKDVQLLLNFVRAQTGVPIKYALWLADMDVVMHDEYGTKGGYLQPGDMIDAYKVGPVVLADLGREGKLYGYKEYPKPFATVVVAPDTREEEFGGDTFSVYTSMS